MRRVFADTVYWLAIFVPGDAWAESAEAVDYSDVILVTTEEVLSEFLAAVSAHGDRTRRLVVPVGSRNPARSVDRRSGAVS